MHDIVNVEIRHGMRPTGNFDTADGAHFPEISLEDVRIQSGTHEDDLEIFPGAQYLSEQYEQEISVKAALVHLIDNNMTDISKRSNNIVSASTRCLKTSKQNTSGDEGDLGHAWLLFRLATDGITNFIPNSTTSFVSYTICKTEGGNPSRLGTDDVRDSTQLPLDQVIQHELHRLCRFSRTSLTRDDGDITLVDCPNDVISQLPSWQ